MTSDVAATRAKRLLPLFDDTVPVACTIGDDEKTDRLALLTRLRSAATSIERTDTGLVLAFERDPAVEDDVRRFAVDEKRCCQFWGFAVVESDTSLALRWDGPPTAATLLDTIEAALRSDSPIESLGDLL